MTNIVLIRHGETVWHHENRYAGSSDVSLTALGRRQADALADWATTSGIVTCWSSDLSRARDTLAPVASATGLSPRHDARLRELDFGNGEGRTAAEMRERFGEQYEAFRTDPVGAHLPGGEHPEQAVRRALECLIDIRAEAPDGRVLLVWHATLLRLVLCRLLGIATSEYRRAFPTVRNGALTEIRLSDDNCALLQFNTPIDDPTSEDTR